MKIQTAVLGFFSGVCATGILLYVSLTTGLGPWLAPTIVLLAGALLRSVSGASGERLEQELVIVQTIGSVGGAVATAIGFSLPTLYFLQPQLFTGWLANPLYFMALIGSFTLAAGWYGIWLARLFAPRLLADKKLTFPVSTVIYETILSQAQRLHARMLFFGAASTWVLTLLRDGWRGVVSPVIQKTMYILPAPFSSIAPLQIAPVYWSVGYLAGWPIVFPLIVGLCAKYLIVLPLNNHAQYLPFTLFSPLSQADFIFAFCSGIVVSGTLSSLLPYPRRAVKWVMSLRTSPQFQFGQLFGDVQLWWRQAIGQFAVTSGNEAVLVDGGSQGKKARIYSLFCRHEGVLVLSVSFLILTYLAFPLLSQVLLLASTAVATYYLMLFAGRTGLAPYGRFMTFVMIPLFFLFALNDIHLTFLCMFVGIAGAAGADLLFDYKVARLSQVNADKIHRAQLFGLLIAALCVGAMVWLLCTQFELGSGELIAYRGRSRALLLSSYTFNWWVLGLGALFAQLLDRLSINSTLAFGGLLMTNDITIGLALGALCRSFFKNPEEQTPFWSGVFAGDSLWVLCTLLVKLW